MSTHLEPAIKSYFFGKGYRDLGAVIEESWRRNKASASSEFSKAAALWPGEYPEKGLALIRGSAGVSVLLFGTAFFLLASAVHITVLGLFFLLVYLGFSLVYMSECLYLAYKKFFAVCPDCHSKCPLPEYFCPKCGEIHRRLIPSSYGILRRICQCGHRLPATFFLQRGKLDSRCPECESMLKKEHMESRKAFVPIIGGPSVGKSAFLFSAIRQLVEVEAPRLGWNHSFVETRTEQEYTRAKQMLEQGQPPHKTTQTLPRAFNLKLVRQQQSPRVLYLYDPAGEAYTETDGLVLHRYQEFLSGIIFLIDPFAIPSVRQEYRDRLNGVQNALKPSPLPLEDALARLLISMEEHFGLSKAGQIKQPVAVVINKIDAFDLESRIGEAVVEIRLKASLNGDNRDAVRDKLIREQLMQWNLGDLVQQLGTRCKLVRYFSCSSLGRMPDQERRAFQPHGILRPLLWILGRNDSFFGDSGVNN